MIRQDLATAKEQLDRLVNWVARPERSDGRGRQDNTPFAPLRDVPPN